MHQNHRNNDPPTSALAGQSIEVSGSAQKQRTQCLIAVIETPDQTAREIEARIGIKAHKRLPELREEGLVRNGPARICTVSGRLALTWLPNRCYRVFRLACQFPLQPTSNIGAHACH